MHHTSDEHPARRQELCCRRSTASEHFTSGTPSAGRYKPICLSVTGVHSDFRFHCTIQIFCCNYYYYYYYYLREILKYNSSRMKWYCSTNITPPVNNTAHISRGYSRHITFAYILLQQNSKTEGQFIYR